MDQLKQPGIRIGQIFLDNVSFRHREDYLSISPRAKAEVGDIDLQFAFGITGDESKGIIHAKASTKPENKPSYVLDLTMTALIERDPEFQNMTINEYVEISAIPLMISFLRQAVADITLRGRFGPVWLNPINLRVSLSAGPTREVSRKKKTTRRKKSVKKKSRKKPSHT